MGKFNKKGKKVVAKSRKEKRKDERKEKKQRRSEFYVNRVKPGQFVLNPTKTNENDGKGKIKDVKTAVKKTSAVDVQAKEIKKEQDAQKKLQKEMNRQRKKQLKVANLEEDKNIKQLEKHLKLNKRKNKSIPKSFSADGLDYLLEVCDPENMKSIAAAEQQFTDLNDAFDDDFALVTGKSFKKSSQNDEDSALDSDEDINTDDEIDPESDFDEESDEDITNFDEESDEFSHENSDLSNDEIEEPPTNKSKISKKSSKDSKKLIAHFSDDEIVEKNLNKKRKNNESIEPQKKLKIQEDSDEDDFEEEEEEEGSKPEIWEDIYGRTRSKDGVVVTKTDGKYIPPALRAMDDANSSMDQKRAEKIARLRKQLKGLLNRLAESNLHNISTQIENMYMANSRNDMNETLTKLIFEALIAPVTTPERLLLEYVLLVTILHANVGTEVGAHFLQTLIKKFDDLYHENQPVENKELDNSVHAIAQLYNFKVFHSQLLYQVLAKLSDKFEEKHVECILLVLKNVGFSLRKDDPLALKQLILDLQKKANTNSDDNSRVKYMLDILLAIKNNNVSKIPNYDTAYSEHLKKLQKNFVRKGNYVTQLNISLEDLLRADERGRWWIVGSAWTGNEVSKQEKKDTDAPSHDRKLLDLARKQRMNTDTRRNIFCALMSAENFMDAFEKLLSLGLKNQQEREIINVILHCSLQEKEYNPYYTLLTQKFCEYDRKYQMTIRCSIWDKLKTLTDCSGQQISILARILTHLFLNQGLPISVLKVVHFSELDQVTLRLIRQVLIGVLLHDDKDSSIGVFDKVATSPKLKIFRESLRLFIHHFLLRNLSKSELSDESKELLNLRAKLAEKALTAAENKIKF